MIKYKIAIQTQFIEFIFVFITQFQKSSAKNESVNESPVPPISDNVPKEKANPKTKAARKGIIYKSLL